MKIIYILCLIGTAFAQGKRGWIGRDQYVEALKAQGIIEPKKNNFYQGAPLGPDGRVVDTPEVAKIKEQHFVIHAAAAHKKLRTGSRVRGQKWDSLKQGGEPVGIVIKYNGGARGEVGYFTGQGKYNEGQYGYNGGHYGYNGGQNGYNGKQLENGREQVGNTGGLLEYGREQIEYNRGKEELWGRQEGYEEEPILYVDKQVEYKGRQAVGHGGEQLDSGKVLHQISGRYYGNWKPEGRFTHDNVGQSEWKVPSSHIELIHGGTFPEDTLEVAHAISQHFAAVEAIEKDEAKYNGQYGRIRRNIP